MSTPSSQLSPETVLKQLLAAEAVKHAFQFFESESREITARHIAICSIPSPPFGEQMRAEHLRPTFQALGLSDTGIDREGNCIAFRAGCSVSPLVVISAHLDTVFPPETDFTVRVERGKLYAPGIADDGAGLAALIAIADALQRSNIQTDGSILFVGTVGEEGQGNLRGVRYLFSESEWAKKISAFISLDGPGLERITHAALGSRRYHVRLTGTGGHSWGDFGTANPVHALGRAIAGLAAYPAPSEPKTTFNVGRIAGGAGINVIPAEATMEVDLRSEGADELLRLDAYFRKIVREAAEVENASQRRQGKPPLELELKLIGDRPSGEVPSDSFIVELAIEATTALGFKPRLDRASTDANIPIAMGLPAITIGSGGASGASHTLNEWYDPKDRHLGLKRASLVLLGLTGVSETRDSLQG